MATISETETEKYIIDIADSDGEGILEQLKRIPSDGERLVIKGDVPDPDGWKALGKHLDSVRELEIDAGWDESLTDDIPLHWPLDNLLIVSSCGEAFTSPFVLEGRLKRLSLFFTAGLRFEGPSSEKLVADNKRAIEAGEKEREKTESGIEITWVPELVQEWMSKAHNGEKISFPPDTPAPFKVNLEQLDIVENDALEMFCHFLIARPHVVNNISKLYLRSTNACDWGSADESWFKAFLPACENLRSLTLVIGHVFEDETYLNQFYENFPPQLTELNFRGPATVATSQYWAEWVHKFGDKDFLPDLKRFSFVLDIGSNERKDDGSNRAKGVLSNEERNASNDACKDVYRAARKRGVEVVPFVEIWNERSKYCRAVDETWTLD